MFVIGSVRSLVAVDATVTVAKELPLVPVTEVGSSVNVAGGRCGVSVVVEARLPPFNVAVIVTGVLDVTALVGIGNWTDGEPAGTVTVAGGIAAGESLEIETITPPGGASPLSSNVASSGIPLVILKGVTNDCSVAVCTVNVVETEVPLSDAVSTTVVGSLA